jgi:hypothetical protein
MHNETKIPATRGHRGKKALYQDPEKDDRQQSRTIVIAYPTKASVKHLSSDPTAVAAAHTLTIMGSKGQRPTTCERRALPSKNLSEGIDAC